MKQNTQQFYQEAILKAISYIENNLSRPIYIDEVAQIAHLSKYHFHRIFKAYCGYTINTYTTRIRIEKTAVALYATHKSIKDIALEFGFNDTETFIHAFTKHFNMTPSVFREEQRTITISKVDDIIGGNGHLQLEVQPPSIVTIQPIKIAFIRHVGNYDTVGTTWEKLIKWGYRKWLLGWKPKMIGIPHDNPQITAEENIRYDACVAIRKEISCEGNIQYKEIVGGQYATFNYKGPYYNLDKVYNYIYGKWVIKNNYSLRNEPGFEWYKNNPKRTKPDNLSTTIYIPIQ